MSAPTPREIYDFAEREGRRRLDMPPLEQVSTGFIAGVTIVFGITALAVTQALVEPAFGAQVAQLAGALAFGIGVVFLVVGRSELFSENFFDPVAAAIDDRNRRVWLRLLRLWGFIFVLNLVGGAVLVAVMTIDGALPHGSSDVLVTLAEDIVGKESTATFARAILAGALLSLLSYMDDAVDTAAARILVAFMVGFLLATGPFDHVIVSALQVLFGIWLGAPVGYDDLAVVTVVSTVGNVVGGLFLITLTHTAQVKGGERERES